MSGQQAYMGMHEAGHNGFSSIRASKIRSSQQAIKIKVVYLCLVGDERRGERRTVESHARVSSSTCFYAL
jgi:hypothetical protein